MSVSTETNVSVIESLDFDVEGACEHVQHEVYPEMHEGAGEWWVKIDDCPSCGFNFGIRLVCDKWKKIIVSDPDREAMCFNCWTKMPIGNLNHVFTRKD